MKYLLVFLVVVVAWNIWRSKRISEAPPPPPAASPLAPTEPLVHCAVCGVHLPQSEAIGFQQRYFCTQKHLAAAAAQSAP